MKKTLLLSIVLTGFMFAVAQAPSPYPYFSFKKNDGVTPTYSIPDPLVSSAAALDAFTLQVNTQAVGLQCINFDQASATDASSLTSDYLKTCGPTSSAFAEAATNSAIRGWVVDEVTPFVAGSVYSTKNEPWLGFNANPQTFRFSGGWYYYTVNFTEAAEYEFFLRLRSGNMKVVGKLVGGVPTDVEKIVTVQIYDKTDMATPLKTWTLNYAGISASANPPASTESTDQSVKFLYFAKLLTGAPIAGQAASFWSKAAQTYTVPAAGEYVIKITDPTLKLEGQDTAPAAGDTNNAVGSFTFIKKTVAGINDAKDSNAFAAVTGKLINFSSDVQQVDIFNLLGENIKSEKLNKNSMSINETGVYILRMTTDKGSNIQKIIIK